MLAWIGKGKAMGRRPAEMAGDAVKTGRKTTDFRYPSMQVGAMAFSALVRRGKVGRSMTDEPILGVLPSVRIQGGLDVDVAAATHNQAHQHKAHKKNYFFRHKFPLSLPGH
jgi:hypothetical protein